VAEVCVAIEEQQIFDEEWLVLSEMGVVIPQYEEDSGWGVGDTPRGFCSFESSAWRW
jgi:hypothetical protein